MYDDPLPNKRTVYSHVNHSSYVILIFVPLLSLLCNVQRHYYEDKNIQIKPFERGSLFLNVPRDDAERGVWPAAKYWANHFFEIYGLEASSVVPFVFYHYPAHASKHGVM